MLLTHFTSVCITRQNFNIKGKSHSTGQNLRKPLGNQTVSFINIHTHAGMESEMQENYLGRSER